MVYIFPVAGTRSRYWSLELTVSLTVTPGRRTGVVPYPPCYRVLRAETKSYLLTVSPTAGMLETKQAPGSPPTTHDPGSSTPQG
jgi:hypothetical protein